MTKVTILERDGYHKGFIVKGHAGYDEYGYDIVCAAISVLTINCINSIEEFTNDTFKLDQDERTGRIELLFNSIPGDKSQLLIDSMILGLREIMTDNKDYITLDFKEV